jgi:hypothetical protein
MRGQPGNALKTLLGIPVALGADRSRLTIEGAGTRHEIAAWITPAGEVKTDHVQDIGPEGGARISITMPRDGLDWNPALWAFRFALFNPHAAIQIRGIGAAEASFKQAKSGDHKLQEFSALVHLKTDRDPAVPLGNFVREFRGMSRAWRQIVSSIGIATLGSCPPHHMRFQNYGSR